MIPSSDRRRSDLVYLALFVATGVVWVMSLFLEIVGVDASQYASISREMADNGQWLEVQHRGERYDTLERPDKPPLLFWLSAASIYLFGATEWAYRLPSTLGAALAVWSVYGFAKVYYDERTSRLAALMFATSQAAFLMVNDVRTDTLLTAFFAFSLWQAAAYLETGERKRFWLGFTGLALGLLAKGPIAAVALGAAVFADRALRRKWGDLFKWQWLLGLAWALLLLAPMVYGLYKQFGAYGPYVYFWEQSFGRVTGQNVWKDDSDSFFFVHTFAWSFLPWTLFLLPAVYNRFRANVVSRFRLSHGEGYSFWGFVLILIALSQSQYKLPHYIYVIVPQAAVFTADYVSRNADAKGFKRLAQANFFFIGHALWAVPVLLLWLCFPAANPLPYAALAIGYALWWLSWVKAPGYFAKAAFPTATLIVTVNFVLVAHVFPARDVYEAGNRVGVAYREALRSGRMSGFRINLHAVDFYGRAVAPRIDEVSSLSSLSEGHLLFLNAKGKAVLDSFNVRYEVVKSYPDYDVTRMTKHFLVEETRLNGRLREDGSRKPVLRELHVVRLK